MTDNKKTVVVGYGNVGRCAVEAVTAAPDLELAGIVRRDPSDRADIAPEVPVVGDVEALDAVDVALLCTPTRAVPETASDYLLRGIHTVDSYDIHGDLVDMRRELGEIAREHGCVAIVSAGWDPGTDSLLRAMLRFMAPRGITHTHFGPGMSMGHTVAVRALDGVADALSLTIPAGQGAHRRLVYVQLEAGADFDTVRDRILADPYFRDDDTRVEQVDDVGEYIDVGHGVKMERRGGSGRTHNQQFTFDMRINNPALTSQVMTAAARASFRQRPGAYTMLEVPVLDFLSGDREALLRDLV